MHFALTQEFIDRFSKIVPDAKYHAYENKPWTSPEAPKDKSEKEGESQMVQVVSDNQKF